MRAFRFVPVAAAAVLVWSSLQAAELGDQEMAIEFDSSEIDMRKDEHHFRGHVRISQGPMSIASDQAMAQGAAQGENSRWTFEHNVHVQTAEADLRADTAHAAVVKGAIANASVQGAPAVFEQRSAAAEKQVRGRAGQIDYDFVRGVVRLTNDVWFSYGDNEFRGAVVVYDVRNERVIVNPEGKNQGRVNITVRPRPDMKLHSPGATRPPAPENRP